MSIWRLVIPILAALTLLACTSGRCRDLSRSHSGAQLFQVYCASCHGADARGNGPVAEFLSVRVPDLTKLAVADGGEFPLDKVYRIIDGQSQMPVHGERHMPVWEYEFFGAEADDQSAHQQATDKVNSLVNYLRTLQQPQ